MDRKNKRARNEYNDIKYNGAKLDWPGPPAAPRGSPKGLVGRTIHSTVHERANPVQ